MNPIALSFPLVRGLRTAQRIAAVRPPPMTPASTPSIPAATPRRYTLFISYRHADNVEMGRKWATWLHESVENYEIPEDLVGRTDLRGNPVPPSLYPVFRDEEELPADADLSTNLRRALENSGLLVVICSPRAAKSRFVADEIRHFKEIGKSDRILALMIDGEPDASEDPAKRETFGPDAECFPEPLRYGVPGEDGCIDWTKRTEPIAADCRPGGRPEQGWTTAAAYQAWLEIQPGIGRAERNAAVRAYAERLELAKLKVIAGALGLPLGELTQRDKARQLRKARQRSRLLIGLSTVFALLAAAAALLGWIANERRQEADIQRKQADTERRAADVARAEAEREKQQAVATLAASDFQEGIHRLQQPGTARDGLAYLARAARAGHPAAATRIWTLFQERSFWLPAAAAGDPPAPAPRRMREIKPPRRFGNYAEPTWYAESADGKRCITVVSNALAGEGTIAFRFWTTAGEPIGPWRSLDYEGDSYLSGIDAAALSDDGRFAAIVASPWRQPQIVEVWDVDLGRPIDKPFPAGGGHPNDQGGAFGDLWFQPAEPDAPGPLLVTLSNRGSATVHRLDTESSTIWRIASNEHDQPVILAELRPGLDLFASAAVDGSVHICRLSTGEAVGWPLRDIGAVEALRIDAADRITLLAGGKASSWSLIRPERLPGPSQQRLQGNRQKGLQKTWPAGDEEEPAADAPLPVDELGDLRLQILDRSLLQVVDASQSGAPPFWSRRFPSSVAHARFVSDELVLAQTEFFSTELWNLRSDALEAPAIRESSLFAPGNASDTVLLSSLSPDRSRLLTRSFRWIPPNVGIHAFTVWDTATGKPLSDRRLCVEDIALDEGDTPPETHAEFSADGVWLFFGRCGNNEPDTVTSHLQLIPPSAVVPLIPDLAEALGGLRLGSDNNLQPVSGNLSATLDTIRRTLAD